MKNQKNKNGFTLVEMLIAIGILAILATLTFVALDPIAQLQKSQDGRRKSDLAQMQRALEQYYNDTGRYPQSTGSYQILDNVTTVTWGSSWQPYIAIVPKDPATSRTYIYYAPADGQSYYLYASLERGNKDEQACQSGGNGICASLQSNGISGGACGTSVTCNYGVSSGNAVP